MLGINPEEPNESSGRGRKPAHCAGKAEQLRNESLPAPAAGFSGECFHAAKPLPSAVAVEVTALFQEIYGVRHFCPEFQDPDRLSAEVAAGRIVSFIARAPNGAAAAHGALLEQGGGLWGMGRLFVSPRFQRQGLARRLTVDRLKFVDELAVSERPAVLRCDLVTTHSNSQRLYSESSFLPSGLYDAKYPDLFAVGRRESTVVLTMIGEPEIRRERQVFLPDCYHALAAELYALHGCRRSIAGSRGGRRLRKGSSHFQRDDRALTGMGIVEFDVGPALDSRVMTAVIQSDLTAGVEHAAVRLALGDPRSIDQAVALRALGFYFAALEPHLGGDFLVLQRRRSRALAPFSDQLELFDPAAVWLSAELIRLEC